MKYRRLSFLALACAAVMALGSTAAVAKPTPTPGQASITLTNCNAEPCYAKNTNWDLAKTTTSQSITLPDDSPTITWAVTATRGATSPNVLSIDGVITVTNTGSANATIGNIVVNLQKKVGSNWVSAASDIADATNGDAATTAMICSGGSSEGLPSFTESSASGSLEFTDANGNTAFSLTPQVSLAPGASITLLYTANFDNTVLGLAVGTQVRAEAIVTFGNSGARGGSGSTCDSVDINGNTGIDTDEAHVRSVPCRVTKTIPPLKNGNDTVTLSDMESDVTVSGPGISVSNFMTFNDNSGMQNINDDETFSVSVDASCTPPGSGTITNTAHLDGTSCFVSVQGPQIGTDPNTGAPIYATYIFPCVTGVALDAVANTSVACEAEPPPPPTTCTYTKGGYGGPGGPGQLFDNNYLPVFLSGLTIGINDGAGLKHDALWNSTATGKAALKTYLTSSASGPSTALTADTTDATSTSGGQLSRQTATLTLNVGFGIKLVSGTPVVDSSGFGDLTLCNLVAGSPIGSWTLTAAQAAALNGTSVSDVLADANDALGGNGLPGYVPVGSFGDLNELVNALNQSFDNCNASAFAIANLCQP